MNSALDHLLSALAPATPGHQYLRLKFGLLCARRVRHLVEHAEVLDCIELFAACVDDQSFNDKLDKLSAKANALANGHEGSKSLDGVGHAAVSATYAVANAIAGKARQAAEYAAYAMVYGAGGYGATSDPDSFRPEHEWQIAQLQDLLAIETRQSSSLPMSPG